MQCGLYRIIPVAMDKQLVEMDRMECCWALAASVVAVDRTAWWLSYRR